MTRLVAVLGYSGRHGGDLHEICVARVAHAQTVVREDDAVLLSGEAELMNGTWPGADALLDPRARNTRENALAVGRAVRTLEADEVLVITSQWHALRARMLVRAALGGTKTRVSSSSPRGRPPLTLALRELACLGVLPLQMLSVLRSRSSAAVN
jgi:uncharacterized SAM-binding protein YcdF (DUF218 family)